MGTHTVSLKTGGQETAFYRIMRYLEESRNDFIVCRDCFLNKDEPKI